MKEDRRIKVLIAKPGLDGHDRGVRVIAQGLRDEGMEVVYTGLRQTPEMIAVAAVQENVDVVGLSCLSGAYRHLFPRVVELLKERGAGNIPVIGGGIIPEDEIPFLRDKGISAIFGPGTAIKTIADFIRDSIKR